MICNFISVWPNQFFKFIPGVVVKFEFFFSFVYSKFNIQYRQMRFLPMLLFSYFVHLCKLRLLDKNNSALNVLHFHSQINLLKWWTSRLWLVFVWFCLLFRFYLSCPLYSFSVTIEEDWEKELEAELQDYEVVNENNKSTSSKHDNWEQEMDDLLQDGTDLKWNI